MVKQKISWVPIISVTVSILGLAYAIGKTNMQTHERVSTLEGTVAQLARTVDSINSSLLRTSRIQIDNTKRIDNNEKGIAAVKQKVVKTQQVLKEIKEQQN